MEHDDIMGIIEETIQERTVSLCSSAKRRTEYEKAEFGFGYTITEWDADNKISGQDTYVKRD